MIRKFLAAVAAAALLGAGAAGAAYADPAPIGPAARPVPTTTGAVMPTAPHALTSKPSHLARTGAGLVCPANGCYYYAGGQQTGISPGVKDLSALVTIDDPWVSSSTYVYHSLVELTVQDQLNPVNNVIEFGWTRDVSGLYADTKPRLFTSLFVGGAWQGYNVGFVDNAANPINMGADLTPYLNTDKQMSITYVAAVGATPARWWLYFDTAYVGYFPAASIPGLNSGGSVVQAFGEVDAKDDHPCSDMVTNPAVLATSTTGGHVSSTTYNASTTGVSLIPFATNSTWYNGVLKSGSVRTVNIGGPGSC